MKGSPFGDMRETQSRRSARALNTRSPLDPALLGSGVRTDLLVIVLISLTCLVGCKEDMTPVDGWALLAEDLFGTQTNAPLEAARANGCPLSRRDYCVEDEAFIRAAVQAELDEHAGGEMPATRTKVRRLMTGLGYAYGERLRSEEGLEQVRALLRARFDAPVSGEIKGELVVDYGVVPFAITSEKKSFAIGPLTDPDIWTAPDIGRRLQAATKAHPDAKMLHLVASFAERGTRGRGLSLTDRHVIYRPGGPKLVTYTEEGKTRYIATLPARGLAALVDGEVTLGVGELEKCVPRRSRGERPGELCRP